MNKISLTKMPRLKEGVLYRNEGIGSAKFKNFNIYWRSDRSLSSIYFHDNEYTTRYSICWSNRGCWSDLEYREGLYGRVITMTIQNGCVVSETYLIDGFSCCRDDMISFFDKDTLKSYLKYWA